MEKVGNKLNTGFPICLFSCGSPPLYKHCPPHIDFLIFEPAHFEALTFSFKKMNLFERIINIFPVSEGEKPENQRTTGVEAAGPGCIASLIAHDI